MTNIKKENLKQIWNWLEQRITPEDLAYLEKTKPGILARSDNNGGKLRVVCGDSAQELLFTIQDVLNAKRKKDRFGYPIWINFPREDVVLLTEMAGLQARDNVPKQEMLNNLMLEIGGQ